MEGYFKNEYRRPVINGYEIEILQSKERMGLKDIQITYKTNGAIYLKSQMYKNLTDVTVERVREKLFDNTVYNLNINEACQAISLMTIIYQVEDIISGRMM